MTFHHQKHEQNMPQENVLRIKDLFKKFREGDFKQEDMIILAGDGGSLPSELMKEVDKIDLFDCYQYKDGIDTDSLSYKFNNILQMFRVNFAVEIRVQAEVVKIQEQAYSDQEFASLLQRCGFDKETYANTQMFEPDFDFSAVLGELNLLS